jgi:hypothetical protein
LIPIGANSFNQSAANFNLQAAHRKSQIRFLSAAASGIKSGKDVSQRHNEMGILRS